MDKTALEFVLQTARIVNLLTAHVVVILVGWDLTVVLVFVKEVSTSKMKIKHGSTVLYFEKYHFIVMRK